DLARRRRLPVAADGRPGRAQAPERGRAQGQLRPRLPSQARRHDLQAGVRRKRMTDRPTILVFDSGLGGLTVFREVAAARPHARFVYVADDAFFPYSGRGETELVERVVALFDTLIKAHRPDLAVIACNTASTIVLPQLRARFAIPFVGTVPAIKPA